MRITLALVALLVLGACAAAPAVSPDATAPPSPALTASGSPIDRPSGPPTGPAGTGVPPSSTPIEPSGSPSGAPVDPSALLGAPWRLVGMDDEAVPADAGVTLVFDTDGQAGGSGGCNEYGAPYALDGAGLLVGEVTSTLIGCEDVVAAREQRYYQLLPTMTSWSVTGGRLVLTGADDATLTFDREVLSGDTLVGPTWHAIELGGVPVPDGVRVTMTFGEDGIVFGGSGCNEYSGPFTVDGESLSFGGLATTEMACEEPRMGVERAFQQAVTAVTRHRLVDGRLHLLGAPDDPFIVFEPGPSEG